MHPIISPDGKRIVYSVYTADNLEMHVVGMDGSNHHLLCQDFYPIDWSPDGEHILGSGTLAENDKKDYLVWVACEDGSIQAIKPIDKEKGQRIALSTDGRHIAHNIPQQSDSAKCDILAFSIESKQEIQLVQHPADDELLGWAPDGKHVLFASDRLGTWDAWLLSVDNGQPQGLPQLVSRNFGNVNPKGFTPSGAYYYQVEYNMGGAYIAKIDTERNVVLSSPEPLRQVGWIVSPHWSPDGKYLAYSSMSPDRLEPPAIYIRTLADGRERKLEHDLPFFRTMRWSHDSGSLLVSRMYKEGWSKSVYRIDMATGDNALVLQTDDMHISRIELSPDGKNLFYSGDNKLVCRDLQSQQEKEIPLLPQKGWVAWNLSPDSKHLVFVVNEDQPENDYRKGIVTAPLQGGKTRQLLEWENKSGTLSDVTWMPNGKHILFTFQPEGPFSTTEFWRISTDGDEPKRLLTTNLGWCESLRVHPDGQRIAFAASQRFHEMWVMENFLPAE